MPFFRWEKSSLIHNQTNYIVRRILINLFTTLLDALVHPNNANNKTKKTAQNTNSIKRKNLNGISFMTQTQSDLTEIENLIRISVFFSF